MSGDNCVRLVTTRPDAEARVERMRVLGQALADEMRPGDPEVRIHWPENDRDTDPESWERRVIAETRRLRARNAAGATS